MKIVAGYIRVSAVKNDQAKQRREMVRWLKSNRFNPKSVRWYIDKPTSEVLDQPNFEKLKAEILEGKVRTVVLWHLDRLAFGPQEGLRVLIEWCDKSLRIVSVSQQLDLKSADSGLIGSVLRGVAEMDAGTRRERTKLGLAVARARGREGGRPPVAPSDPKVILAKKLEKNTLLSIDDVCERLNISRSTYYRYVAM